MVTRSPELEPTGPDLLDYLQEDLAETLNDALRNHVDGADAAAEFPVAIHPP